MLLLTKFLLFSSDAMVVEFWMLPRGKLVCEVPVPNVGGEDGEEFGCRGWTLILGRTWIVDGGEWEEALLVEESIHSLLLGGSILPAWYNYHHDND